LIANVNLPSLFLPHGAPTFALRPGAAGLAMSRIAASLPRPRAVVIVSPHWETRTPTVGTGERLETIHDFYGFPAELYEIQYPATGCPEAAREVVEALRAAGLAVEEAPGHGLDHGAWVPLRQMCRWSQYLCKAIWVWAAPINWGKHSHRCARKVF
jgi:4,5-DOPA dioxygenase extradiol